MTQDVDYSWIVPDAKAFYTNSQLMPVLCYVHSECEENPDCVHIYRGEMTGIMRKSLLYKTYKEADKRQKK